MQTLDVPISYRESVARWKALGYSVHGLCPECKWGLIVSNETKGYGWCCTAYGQCELAPG